MSSSSRSHTSPQIAATHRSEPTVSEQDQLKSIGDLSDNDFDCALQHIVEKYHEHHSALSGDDVEDNGLSVRATLGDTMAHLLTETTKAFAPSNRDYVVSGAPSIESITGIDSLSFEHVDQLPSTPSLPSPSRTVTTGDSSIRLRVELMGAKALSQCAYHMPDHFLTALTLLESISQAGTLLIEEYEAEPQSFVEQLVLWESMEANGGGGKATDSIYQACMSLGSDFQEGTESEWTEMDGSTEGRKLFWRYNRESKQVETMADV